MVTTKLHTLTLFLFYSLNTSASQIPALPFWRFEINEAVISTHERASKAKTGGPTEKLFFLLCSVLHHYCYYPLGLPAQKALFISMPVTALWIGTADSHSFLYPTRASFVPYRSRSFSFSCLVHTVGLAVQRDSTTAAGNLFSGTNAPACCDMADPLPNSQHLTRGWLEPGGSIGTATCLSPALSDWHRSIPVFRLVRRTSQKCPHACYTFAFHNPINQHKCPFPRLPPSFLIPPPAFLSHLYGRLIAESLGPHAFFSLSSFFVLFPPPLQTFCTRALRFVDAGGSGGSSGEKDQGPTGAVNRV
ncbi:hypothetical protein IWZ03DRAFT_131134 [Phyllosticta citriasiana]|uniref:Secreted protein n=1 Tax=Phyllosticta citriasiana TaxID=595635 RepID=A0ABR1KRJ3_9PEZI